MKLKFSIALLFLLTLIFSCVNQSSEEEEVTCSECHGDGCIVVWCSDCDGEVARL